MVKINKFTLGDLVGYSAHTKDTHFFDDDAVKELILLGIEQVSVNNDFKTIYWQGELSDTQIAELKLSLEKMTRKLNDVVFPRGH